MEVLILAAILLGSLLLIPLGLPGTWLMVAAAFGYELLVPQGGVGPLTVVGTAVLAAIGEAIEWVLSARYTRKYGGSRRAGWGAIVGGMIGAFMGVPIPIPFVGSMVGAFVGAFVGALVLEYTKVKNAAGATRVAWGAFIGRVAAAAAKVGIGLLIVVWIIGAALLLRG